MKKYLILADLFREDMPHGLGGAELACDALINLLRPHGRIFTKRCQETEKDFIENFDGKIIVSNRQSISPESVEALAKNKNGYILWEHDFAFLKNRDVGSYENFKAPDDQIVNRGLYESASKIVCQSGVQAYALNENLALGDKVVSSGGNPWSQEHLDLLRSMQSIEKNGKYAVLLHAYPTKNTDGAVDLCNKNGWDYKIIPPMNPQKYLEALATCNFLVFLPKVFETYSRVSFEARALGLSLITNKKLGFSYEDHSKLERDDLISYAEENNKKILDLFI